MGFLSLLAFWTSGGGAGISITTTPGYRTATVTNYFVRQATARPEMPIAYIRVITVYNSAVIPDIGERPSSQPVFGQ